MTGIKECSVEVTTATSAKKKKVKAYKPKEPRTCQDKVIGGYCKTD